MKNVSLGKQLQFVNLKMLVLTHLSLSSTSRPPMPPSPAVWAVGEGQGPAAGAEAAVCCGGLPGLPPGSSRRPPWSDQHLSPRNAEPARRATTAGCTDASCSRRLFLLVTDVSKFLRESEDGVWRGRFRELLQNEWRGGGLLPGFPAPLPRTGLPWPRLTARPSPSVRLTREDGQNSEAGCLAQRTGGSSKLLA